MPDPNRSFNTLSILLTDIRATSSLMTCNRSWNFSGMWLSTHLADRSRSIAIPTVLGLIRWNSDIDAVPQQSSTNASHDANLLQLRSLFSLSLVSQHNSRSHRKSLVVFVLPP